MKKVLIIEDEYNNRLLLEEILEDYEEELLIVSVENGELGLQKIKQNTFDILFIDLMLPIISGIEIIDIVKRQLKLVNTKIIVITAGNILDIKKEWYYDYVDSFIIKPYRPKTILDTLNKIIL